MQVANGTADVTTYFVLRDSTNHAPKTDVTITDIDLYYCEQGAAMAAKVDATALAAADSAHADNKAYHVGQGLYRIDWPDTCFDGGVGKIVNLIVVCTGVDTTFLEVELVGVAQTGDSYARLGAPAGASVSADIADLPTVSEFEARTIAAADYTIVSDLPTVPSAADIKTAIEADGSKLDHLWEMTEDDGGVRRLTTNALEQAPTGDSAPTAAAIRAEIDANSTQLAAILTDTGTTLPGTLATIAGYIDTEVAATLAAVDTEVAAIKAKTDNLPASPAATGAAMTLTAAYDAAKTAATQTSVDDLPTNSELATALAGADDAVLTAIADVPTVAEFNARTLVAASYFDPAADTVANVTTVGAVTTVSDKTGYALASDGLDAIDTTAPSGVATNFREMVVQVWRRFFKKATMTSTALKTYADDGATEVTSQTLADDGTTQTQGAAS